MDTRLRLTGISNPGFAATFTYDSFGRRTGKTITGATTNFVYDGLNPMQEKSGSTVTANLLTGLGIDEFFTRTDGVGVRALLTDALGSTIALGDGTGSLVTQYTYEPFGVTTEAGSASTNSYKYTGREDDGTGLLYYRARYYHPRLQRFIAEDPAAFRDVVNVYAYAGNSPILFTDPLGLVRVNSTDIRQCEKYGCKAKTILFDPKTCKTRNCTFVKCYGEEQDLIIGTFWRVSCKYKCDDGKSFTFEGRPTIPPE